MNWREHPLLAMAGLVLIVLVTVVLLGWGCGCGTRRTTAANAAPVAQKNTPPGGKAKKEWMDDCPEPPNWGKEEYQAPKPAAPKPPPPPPPPPTQAPLNEDDDASLPAKAKKSVRPKDIATWTPDNFLSAKRDNDPRLIDAVAYLGKHFVTKESAELLAKLIEPSVVDSVAQRPAPSVAVNPALIEAVVAALTSNSTSTARQILERLVAGTQRSADPQLAATAALKAILQRQGQGNDDLLFHVISASEQTATTDPTATGANKLRATALDWVRSSASEAFRLRLANYMIAAETPAAAFNQIWTSLSDRRVENLAAQAMLFQSGRMTDSVKQSLERQFAEQSRTVMRRLLGFPALKQFQPASGITAPMAESPRVAELLWAGNFTAVVEERLRAAEGSNEGATLLPLACTLPCPAMRATVLRLLEKYWEEGPKRFEPCIASDESLPEPGFLLLVKQLPRKAAKDAHAASGGGAAGDRGGASRASAAKAAKLAAARQAKDRQDKTAKQWLDFSEKLARAMCRQYWAAALARTDTAGADAESVPANFPMKLPANANIVAAHNVEWPQCLGGALADLRLPPLRIHYVRIEQKARPDRLLSYYRRQLPSANEHVHEHDVWVDDFNIDRNEGCARSVDLFISKPNKDVGMLLNQEQQVIVELLTVEVLPQADN